MPADGVVIDTPATCDPATVPPIRCGVTNEFGRRASTTFSPDLLVASFVEAESVDKGAELVDNWVGPVDEWAEPGNVPATTTTTLPSDGMNLSSLLPVVVATAAAAVALAVCPMPQ